MDRSGELNFNEPHVRKLSKRRFDVPITKDRPGHFKITQAELEGYLPDMLADLQAQIIEAVQNTSKQGTLTLKLKYVRNGKKQIDVIPEVTPKIPVEPIKPVSMFVTDDHKLLEEDPLNKPLSMEDVIDINTKQKAVN